MAITLVARVMSGGSMTEKTEEELSIKEPPRNLGGILKELGPGLIVAAAVVGSGELIATTATGAQAGFYLLWLIIIGCIIKVFVQVEIGRFTITTGKTSLEGMQLLPGPRIGKVNWVIACWLCMIVATSFQMGGIVGGVGQSMALTIPLTESGKEYNELMTQKTLLIINHQKSQHDLKTLESKSFLSEQETSKVEELRAKNKEYATEQEYFSSKEVKGRIELLQATNHDDVYWCVIITVVSIFMLVKGGYSFIASFVTVLIACFTLATVLNLMLLQTKAEWAIPMSSVIQGLQFKFPPLLGDLNPVDTALATFGIIGVAAGELIFYPYWCLEAGYAKFVGPKDDTPQWGERAEGWLNVMRWDAWCSLVIYTLSTVVFYLLGAGILYKIGLVPEKNDMIRTLGMMYVPVFGEWAQWVFLFGAFAVLFSTFFVGNASKARVMADALNVLGLKKSSEKSNLYWKNVFCVFLPTLCVLIYASFKSPTFLVLIGGLLNAFMLPVMAICALYYRYKFMDNRILPGIAWDIFLWVSAFGLMVSGGYAAISKVISFL